MLVSHSNLLTEKRDMGTPGHGTAKSPNDPCDPEGPNGTIYRGALAIYEQAEVKG